MPTVHFNTLARNHRPLRGVRSRGPLLRQFASKQGHDRPLLVAGSLIALGLLPVAAYASKRAFGRSHVTAPMAELVLPRNQEWYAGE